MPVNVLLKALGLNTAINQLDVPPGSMIEAKNVVISDDNIITPRRGFKVFGQSFGTSTDRAKQLFSYRNRILRHYSNKLQFQTGNLTTSNVAIFNEFDGNFSETETGLRIKSVESNGNLYFTTSEGIKKISAKDPDEFSTSSGYITQAGGLKAVDLIAEAEYELGDQTSFLPQDSTVAYRILWSIKDANNNIVPGVPSQRAEVYNSLLTLLLQDFHFVLGALDDINQTGSLITDGNYVDTLELNINSSASELRTNLISLASKIDTDIRYAYEFSPGSYPLDISAVSVTSNVVTITFSTGNPTDYFVTGSKVEVSGFADSATASLDGTFSLTAVTATTISYNKTAANGAGTFTGTAFIQSNEYRSITQPAVPSLPATNAELVAIQDYLDAIITRLQTEPIAVISSTLASAYIDTLDITKASNVTLEITVPQSATVNHYYQIYRSDISQATGTTVLSDLTPNDEMKLVYEAFPTSSELTSKKIIVEDITPDLFRGANLYTNEATGEGIAQANDLPPFAKDVNRFKGYTFYANTKTLQRRLLSLLGVVNMVTDYGTGLNSKTFVSGDVNTSTDIITIASHGFSNNQSVEFSNSTPSNLPGGLTQSQTYYILNATTNTFQVSLTKSGAAIDLTSGGTGTHTIKNQLPKLVISNGTTSNTYDFVVGRKEVTSITTLSGASLNSSGTADYFLINSANNEKKYYVWYKIGTASDPLITGRIGIPIVADAGDTANQIATKTRDTLTRYIADFTASVSTNIVTVTNVESGYADDTVDGTTGFTISVTTQGRGEKITQEQTNITCVADVAGSLGGTYFTLDTAFDKNKYYIWFNVSGTGIDPMVSGRVGIEILLVTNDSASTVATKIKNHLNINFSDKFTASSNSSLLSITNVNYGPATDATAGTSGFSISIVEQGALEILLSDLVSVGQAVDETARSLVRIINKNSSDLVNAFYLSTAGGVPGQMLLESRNLSDNEFYILGTNDNVGISFNPDISPENFIISNSVASSTVITSSSAHGLVNGDQVIIVNSNSSPSIDGLHNITYISNTTFSIPVNMSVAGTMGSFIKTENGVFSDNEEKPNRIYYSKFQQPEAVPLVNFLDVGSQDREILRIFPLRDSLFVFKEDGLFRISGEIAPFVTALFDSSCILKAPDSVSVANNLVYGWTSQGISSISESGVDVISRNIDNITLRLSSDNFTNFQTATWGLGYDSDNAYIVYTVNAEDDESATIGYRYDQVTQTWTTIDKSYTCGVIHFNDDKMYVGSGDGNTIEQERKQFTRLDYADKELEFQLASGQYFDDIIKLFSITGIDEGDVLFQEQRLTIYQFNQLLKKLDNDAQVVDSNYFSTLQSTGGDNIRTKLISLAQKLDADTGVTDTDYFDTIDTKSGSITSISIANPTVITTSVPHELETGRIVTISGSNSDPLIDDIYEVTVLSSTTFSIPVNVNMTAGTTGTFNTVDTDFRDIQACYNAIIDKLNLDTGVNFSNYQRSTGTTIHESVITNVNTVTKELSLNLILPYIQGPIFVFKSIPTSITYSPITFDDPMSLKHIREATMMFANKAFTNATMSFASDLLPEFKHIEFNGDGNGIFGHFSFGTGFFGGGSHGAPFRTYIPAEKARCRYIVVKFQHSVAREFYQIYGITLTGESPQSSRAYR